VDASVVNSFIIGCVLLLVGLVGFLGKNWFSDQKKSNEKLADTLDRLIDLIDRVERVQDLHSWKIEQIEKDIAMLAAGVGRRKADVCASPDCPFEDTRPGTSKEKDAQLTGSGAKILKDLIEAAKASKPK
jgi:hypothetical protein